MTYFDVLFFAIGVKYGPKKTLLFAKSVLTHQLAAMHSVMWTIN
jgi:hypothetical protein